METYKVTVDDEGTTRWYNSRGELHRIGGPSVEYADGSKEWHVIGKQWYVEGHSHVSTCEGKIVETYKVIVDDDEGTTKWYNTKGHVHRVGGPAIDYDNGDKEWYKEWYKEGILHREDGPACEYANGYKCWYKEGNLHRVDGPAVEDANGTKYWYLEDKKYTEAEYNKKLHASTCEGKVVEIDVKKYKLTGV